MTGQGKNAIDILLAESLKEIATKHPIEKITIKEITDKAPAEYMYYFKMNKAKILLVTQKYTVTEIATYLGFCDAKYFGARFKKFYKVPPTRYIKEIL